MRLEPGTSRPASLPDGDYLVSSWGGSSVVRVSEDSETAVAEGVAAPADIGFYQDRCRVFIPQFMDDKVLLQDLPEGE